MDCNDYNLYEDLSNLNLLARLAGHCSKNMASSAEASTTGSTSSFEQQSSSADSEEDDALFSNPDYTEYAKLLRKFKKENPEAHSAAIRRLNLVRDHFEFTNADGIYTINDIESEPSTKRKRSSSETVMGKAKTLEDMNINLLDCKSWKDTSVTWLDYCTKRDDTLGAVMRLKDYLDFQRKTQYSPLFILPIARENDERGEDEFIFTEVEKFNGYRLTNCTVHLTPVTSYKIYKENVPECMTVEYYTDLCKGKEFSKEEEEEFLVLMKATYNKNLLSCSEAKCLIDTLKCFHQKFCDMEEMVRLFLSLNRGVKPFMHFSAIEYLKSSNITV